MAGPLAGKQVLEMANFISGPFAGMLLAELGARVVKVEAPGEGDPFRNWGDNQGAIRPQFAAYNKGKESVTLNIKTPAGKEAYGRIAKQSDVIIENFRSGTADRLGIGYEALKVENPGLIYCAVTGMGEDGPKRDLPTYDATAQATSGLWGSFVDLADPQPIGPAFSDQLTGLYAAYGILGALVARGDGGEGQRVEINMLGASMAFLVESATNYLTLGEPPDPRARPRRSQSYGFVASDGLPLAIHLSSPTKFWVGLLSAVERPDLADDPRFKDRIVRVKNYNELQAELAEVFKTKPREEWLKRLRVNDVPAAPINTVAEAIADPQAEFLGVVETVGKGERALKLIANPIGYAATAPDTPLPPPDLGEHTESVLAGLGFDPGQIKEMRREGAL